MALVVCNGNGVECTGKDNTAVGSVLPQAGGKGDMLGSGSDGVRWACDDCGYNLNGYMVNNCGVCSKQRQQLAIAQAAPVAGKDGKAKKKETAKGKGKGKSPRQVRSGLGEILR